MRILALASKRGSSHASSLAISRRALRGALGLALLMGAQYPTFAHEAGPHEAAAPNRIQTELLRDTAKAVAKSEAAVAGAPQDASLRGELAHAYLRAGRFESATAALSDAVVLGDTTDRTTLSLALAQIACGQNRAALATLDRAASIPPADLGLAVALAGDAGRGIAVLTDAVRDGSASVHLRQNLAYAYALDGRWADATLTAGFDLPPDQVNARLQQWAQSMQSGSERMRIAQLLNVPLIADLGMPAALALNRVQTAPAQTAAIADLPPAPAVATVPPVPMPAVAATAADPAPPARTFVAVPVVQQAVPVVQQIAAAPAQIAYRRPAVHRSFARFVQLAAYHSRHSAELGKTILARRNSLLGGRGLLITEAKFCGRSYWRVVIAGFDANSASNFCSSLRRHGAACFAYSATPRAKGLALALADVPRSHLAR